MLFCNQQYYSMNIQKITLERCFLYKGVCEVPSKKKRQKDINIRSFPKKCSIWLPDRVITFVVWVGGRARKVSQAYRCHQLWPLAPKAHWLEGEWEVVGPQEASSDSSWPKTWVSLEAQSFAGRIRNLHPCAVNRPSRTLATLKKHGEDFQQCEKSLEIQCMGTQAKRNTMSP